MTKTITVTEMTRSISDVIGQVYYRHMSFNIKKGVNIVATLIPVKKTATVAVKDLNNLFLKAPHLEEKDNEFESDIKDLKILNDDGGLNKWE